MPASLICAGVSKSGSPISMWTTRLPSASSAFARASTSNALSDPSRETASANRSTFVASIECKTFRMIQTLVKGPIGLRRSLATFMRTLTDVFTPGAPTIPEGLRTLVVSPERELEPGMTVRASFTFRNQGGATATGVRVRFNLPDGLVYLVGSGELDGALLDDELGNSPLLSRSGANIGDVAPGEERRIEIAYSVAGAIENGTTVELQAAVASFELAPVGSNVVRLIARSRPQLDNALTRVAIEARQDPVPGSEAQITVRMHNAGESSAHDVVVVAPIPEHTSYVAGSARVNGREMERDLGISFDRLYAPIVAPVLAASASATLIYRIRIDAPLADGTA